MSGISDVVFLSGSCTDLFELRKSNVRIETIAHGLSNLCRFCGQTLKFYSVAEHSVLVAEMVPTFAKEALLHDAHEAYIGDIIRPVAKHLGGEHLRLVKHVKSVIEATYGYADFYPQAVKEADDAMLMVEMWRLFTHFNPKTLPLFEPNREFYTKWHDCIQCLPPEEAKALFLEKWKNVQTGNV